ncbi:hypothetical protein KY290_027556 [Solanum tuberosum]|uniref:NB-ARC domain-containing protein n=1 Tax=Solanum tuberosum TaxID=4113 RepID=A0ABQ7UFX9_SOLTU|nr:hypothetical protein KY290_027556 [Solanum tuberosum]
MPTDLILHDTFFDLLSRVGALTREVSNLVWDLEEKSMKKESTNDTNRTTLDLLKDIELLKEELTHVYLKVPDSSQCCFPMSDGTLFMYLLQRHLDVLLDFNAYSIALIKKEIGQVSTYYFITSHYHKENKAYKEKVSNLNEKIPKNRGLIIVNFPKKPVGSKSLTTDKIIVGFEEEKNLILRKLTSGPTDLDVISITGMPGSEKEVALHRKLYTDPLNLRLLRPEESWELLEKRAFGKESCPDEVLDVGKEIAENCKGLPLVVDLIAGVIAGREKKKTVWLEVLNNFHSFIFNNEVQVMKVVEISYDHLPNHLKPCLLHFASKPKDCATTIYESVLIAKDTKLENLRILGKLMLSYSKDTEDIFKRFPNLQDLSFELKESWDYSTEHYWFPKFDFLTELEDLIVDFERSNTNDSGSSAAKNRPWDFHFPSSLKQLWLYDFPLTSDSLSTIARLPNLEELFLYYTIIQGEEDTFENLKCLKLHRVTFSKWEVGEESFPKLKKLKLEGCCDLEEIPPSVGDIWSLKIIKLVESPQLEDSAVKIKEYAEDMRGGDELQVVGKNMPLFK